MELETWLRGEKSEEVYRCQRCDKVVMTVSEISAFGLRLVLTSRRVWHAATQAVSCIGTSRPDDRSLIPG